MIPSKNSHPQLHGRYCTCNQIQKEGGQGNTLDREGDGHGSDGTQQTLLLSLLLHHMFVISDDTDAGAAADKYRYRPRTGWELRLSRGRTFVGPLRKREVREPRHQNGWIGWKIQLFGSNYGSAGFTLPSFLSARIGCAERKQLRLR